MERHVLIIGAGLVGSLAAVYFARRGWRVSAVERRPDPRARGYIGGRSINLALSARGLWGLAGVDLDRTVLDRDAIPMPGRMIHPAPNAGAMGTIFQPYSKNPADAINSVSRGGLNLTLIHAAAAEAGVSMIFDRRCLDVDLDRCRAVFVDDANPSATPEVIEADLIFGGDGAFSAVRSAMQKTDRFEYSQSYLAHGYKELHIPGWPRSPERGAKRPGQEHRSGERCHQERCHEDRSHFALEPNALHIWPRGGSMMIALPNRDGSFTCTLFWPFEGGEGEHSFAHLEGELAARRAAERSAAPSEAERARVLEFFSAHYPDAVPLMPTLVQDFFANPTSSLVTVRCAPWFRMARDGRRATVLAGDAAHAIVPFYGQGMNAGFEDVRVLAECLDRSSDLPAALAEYHALRKPNADAIADMAIENFVEMRDKVGSPAFRYRKRVEQTLHDAFPDRVHPQYNLVSFSTVPYAEARRRGRELDAVLDRVIERLGPDSIERLGESAWRSAVAEAGAAMLA
ncbi:MAG: FAD-dependent monooxygenase [Phycisphaeraceae bacterium]|nr:FAD-dependent monooxygenase [Phycisphaeraceae bacterium]